VRQAHGTSKEDQIEVVRAAPPVDVVGRQAHGTCEEDRRGRLRVAPKSAEVRPAHRADGAGTGSGRAAGIDGGRWSRVSSRPQPMSNVFFYRYPA
jgi:hypothetical protein